MQNSYPVPDNLTLKLHFWEGLEVTPVQAVVGISTAVEQGSAVSGEHTKSSQLSAFVVVTVFILKQGHFLHCI